MPQFASMSLLVATVSVRIIVMLALLKFLAQTFGRDGFGQLTQVMAVASFFFMVAGGGLTHGILTKVAAPDEEIRVAWLKAAVPIVSAFALLLALAAFGLWLFATPLVFPGQEGDWVLLAVAPTQVVVGFGNLALTYLSGTGNLRAYAVANAGGSVLGALLMVGLALVAGVKGAAVGAACLALPPAVLGLLYLRTRIDWAALKAAKVVRERVVELLAFSGSTFVAAAALPLALVFIRADLARRVGWEEVGMWQSVARISDGYMQLFGALFINYMLPQLALLPPARRHRRLREIGLLLLALFVLGAAAFFAMPVTVLSLAYSEAFRPAARFVGWQLVGDGLKIAALVFVYYFASLGRAHVLGGSELILTAGTVAVYLLLGPRLGAEAAVAGYAFGSAVLLLVMGAAYACFRSQEHRLASPTVDGPPGGGTA